MKQTFYANVVKYSDKLGIYFIEETKEALIKSLNRHGKTGQEEKIIEFVIDYEKAETIKIHEDLKQKQEAIEYHKTMLNALINEDNNHGQ